MKVFTSFLLAILLFTTCAQEKQQESDSGYDKLIEFISSQLKASIKAYENSDLLPRSLEPSGEVAMVMPRDWTSGFYAGCLWYQYELTNDAEIKAAAEKYTALLENEKLNGTTHDMGFKMYCSYGNAYRITGEKTYRDILLQSAETLITRFNPAVGCIRSWDHHAEQWPYPVIVDNMMNLELLMWAFKESGDSTYYKIAVSHADKTLENHFREDNSSYHVVDYDPTTGEVKQKNTHQGYADETAWARGQAWGLYGYTMMYRETKLQRYLSQAEKIAQFILHHENLPEDMIPYWDFNAPGIPDEPRDASAAAVISSALFELCTYVDDDKSFYRESAEKILNSLKSTKYLAGENASHHFILEHSTGNWPDGSEIDEPIIYADYYFIEALKRYLALESK